MRTINKNILRGALIASYLLVIVLIILGIGAIYSYLNTGADRSTMLHTEVYKSQSYFPAISWDTTNYNGRKIDLQNLQNIETDYLNAWHLKNIAFQSNIKTGIDDYYTESARENLYNIIDINSANKTSFTSTTLRHKPKLEFFSEDGQLVAFTDYEVLEYQRLMLNDKELQDVKTTNTYKILMLLEDGFWRVRHQVKIESKEVAETQNTIDSLKLNIKGINYYPKDSPWNMFGEIFSKDTIDKDFKILKGAGLNTIRLFVQYADFGKAEVKKDKLDKLVQTLDIAQANNLKVVLTLFDFYGNYDVLDWTLNQRHIKQIASTVKEHPALLAWDIKNEPDLDFDSRGKNKVIAWLKEMVYYLRSQDHMHPITIGWSNPEVAHELQEDLDFISFHYYQDLDNLLSSFSDLQSKVNDKPIVLGEFGVSSYSGIWKPFGGSEEGQADYHQKAQDILTKENISYISWTLYDFNEIPKEVVGRLPWRKNPQKHFGFINSQGEKKRSFKYISGK